MKIAILSQSYPPMISGAALFAEKLAAYFSAAGHEVLVLTASDQPYPYSFKRTNLSVERYRSFHNPFRVGQRALLIWPHAQILRSLEQFAPDLIHLHDPFQMGLSSLFFGSTHQVPVILSIHQLPWYVSAYLPVHVNIQRKIEKLLWKYAGWLLRHCSSATVGSETVAKEIHRNTGIFPHIISYGIDSHAFTPTSPGASGAARNSVVRKRLGIPSEAALILHVGRLDTDKNVEKVIRAAAPVMQKTSAHLLVVGDGTEKLRLEKLCAQLGLSDRCHFPGFIAKDRGLPEIYRQATVFVTASEIETQGLVLLEAAASGLPIVAVKATCVHEVVHDKVNGYLLDPDLGPDLMAEHIFSLIKDPVRAREMGRAGRLIIQNHSMENTFSRFESLYRATIKR